MANSLILSKSLMMFVLKSKHHKHIYLVVSQASQYYTTKT